MNQDILWIILLIGINIACVFIWMDEESNPAAEALIGIIGAIIGGWLLPKIDLGLPSESGLAAVVFNATIGTVFCLTLFRLIKLA